jgi:hypothetical protein
MTNQLLRLTILSVTVVATAILTNAQSNRLQNPNADLQSQSWRAVGQATVETCATGNPCFVVRNGGYFIQDVNVSADSLGRYALLIARASTERVNADGAITGLPSLYGYMMDAGEPRGGRVLDYLQGQNMSLLTMKKDEWTTLSGIFRVPQGTGRIRFSLSQAERKGVPQNGSAARFDDVGLYFFATEQDARAFVNTR